MSGQTPAVQVEHLSKSYGDTRVLTDLCFEAQAGSVTAVVGPNGSGKSTALALMSGVTLGAGRTLFLGAPLSEHRDPAGVLGAMLTPRGFHPRRSARDHLRMVAAASGVTIDQVDDVLEQVGLADVARAAPRTFSLGMAQRLSLATAVLARPQVLLLDEPLNGLDIYATRWFVGYLRALADAGTAIVLTSHVLEHLDGLVDRLVVLVKGRTVASDAVAAIRRSTREARVLVRCEPAAELYDALRARGHGCTVTDGQLEVSGADPREIWQLAVEHDVVVLEMRESVSDLGEVFVEVLRQNDPSAVTLMGGAA